MNIAIIPDPNDSTIAHVVHDTDGVVGQVMQCSPRHPWTDFLGQDRIGSRWLPADLPMSVPGPATREEAAAVLLVLAGYAPMDVLDALGMPRYLVRVGA